MWLQALRLALGRGRGAVLPLSAGAAQGPTLRGTQEASYMGRGGVSCENFEQTKKMSYS